MAVVEEQKKVFMSAEVLLPAENVSAEQNTKKKVISLRDRTVFNFSGAVQFST